MRTSVLPLDSRFLHIRIFRISHFQVSRFPLSFLLSADTKHRLAFQGVGGRLHLSISAFDQHKA